MRLKSLISFLIVILAILNITSCNNPQNNATNECREIDSDMLIIDIGFAPMTSKERMTQCTSDINDIVSANQNVLNTQVINEFSFLNGSDNHNSTILVKLKDSHSSTDKIITQLYAQTCHISDSTILIFDAPNITCNLFEIQVKNTNQDDLSEFFGSVQNFIAQLNQQPEIQFVITKFLPTHPQNVLEIDKAKTFNDGISSESIIDSLQKYCEYIEPIPSAELKYLIIPSNERPLSPGNILSISVPNSNGEMKHIENYVVLSRIFGVDPRSDYFKTYTISIFGYQSRNQSSEDISKVVERVASKYLSTNISYEYIGASNK